jgi:hypothetical protein
MARRLSKKRLFSINSSGERLTSSAGPAMSGAIPSPNGVTRMRDGNGITTEVLIDLASSNGAASAYSASAVGRIIGVSSSAEPHQNAQIIRCGFDQGIITSGELICVEAPAGPSTIKIGLVQDSALSASNALALDKGTVVIAAQTPAIGRNDAFALDDASLDTKYLYLFNSGSNGAAATAFTAGKYVLRLHGFTQFDDV